MTEYKYTQITNEAELRTGDFVVLHNDDYEAEVVGTLFLQYSSSGGFGINRVGTFYKREGWYAKDAYRREEVKERTESEDERLEAWYKIANHAIFNPCYSKPEPLIDSMLERLDNLQTELQEAYASGRSLAQALDTSKEETKYALDSLDKCHAENRELAEQRDTALDEIGPLRKQVASFEAALNADTHFLVSKSGKTWHNHDHCKKGMFR